MFLLKLSHEQMKYGLVNRDPYDGLRKVGSVMP